jgi:hypothetical protein
MQLRRLLLLVLICGSCRPTRVGRDKAPCQPIAELQLEPTSLLVLQAEMYERSTVEALRTPAILNRYCAYPQIINRHRHGLYFFSNQSHRFPIGAILSPQRLTLVRFGPDVSGTQDSVRKALQPHGDQLDVKTRRLILDYYSTL